MDAAGVSIELEPCSRSCSDCQVSIDLQLRLWLQRIQHAISGQHMQKQDYRPLVTKVLICCLHTQGSGAGPDVHGPH